MKQTKISAEIAAHSLSPQGDELISILGTFPRIILAEVNTHRMLCKNTSSSRAIPFKKMVESVQINPFIPIAWQKYHPGMQGSEYLDETVEYDLISFMTILNDTLSNTQDEKERAKLRKRVEEKTQIIQELLSSYIHLKKTLPEWWLFARDKAVEAASIMYVFDVTKQLCNRLLEPFMWTTMLITGSRSGWDNFFYLRCPQYVSPVDIHFRHKSKKDVIAAHSNPINLEKFENFTNLDWLKINKGQAEIHIMDLAEKIYDAVNESTPKQLKAGEWHIPFRDKMDYGLVGDISHSRNDDNHIQKLMVKISTAMGARTSYTVVGDEKEVNYPTMIGLHDRLITQNPPHSSPLEHCAIAMTNEEYYLFNKGKASLSSWDKSPDELHFTNSERGWCGPYKGFKSYRYLLEVEGLKL